MSLNFGRRLIPKRTFWNLARGQATGYVEEIYQGGLFWKHREIKFRVASSNFTTGESTYLSLSKYPISESIFQEALQKRQPLMIKFEVDMLGSPLIGVTGLWEHRPSYVTDVQLADSTYDKIHTIQKPGD